MANSSKGSGTTGARGRPEARISPDAPESAEAGGAAGSASASIDAGEASNEIAPELKEAFESEIAKIVKLGYEYGLNFSFSNLYEHIKIIIERSNKLRIAMAKSDDFIKISEIEELLSSLFNKQQELDMLDFMQDLQHNQSEKQLILKKKDEYLSKGIKLRVFRDYQTSIVTIFGRIYYTRKALIKSPICNNVDLFDNNKFIFPFDEALGVANLPFKMTVPAMLEVAREACLSDTFEEAEQRLKQRTSIVINDDTIRKVTNTIGLLAHENDVKIANQIWSSNPPWKFKRTSNCEINQNTLYLEIDSATVHARKSHGKRSPDNPDGIIIPSCDMNNEYNDGLKEPLDKAENASSWKDNKLAMAFSTDNLLKLGDKPGDLQYIICKKEFTALFGSEEDFKLHFYSLAIKNGYGNYKDTVLLSDGSPWIKRIKNELFDNVINILDTAYLHENILTFSKSIFGANNSNHHGWSNHIFNIILTDSYEAAIKEIQSLGRKKIAKGKFDLIQYLINNKDSINYKKYLANGFFISRLASESANRSDLQRRLRLPGTRWSLESGQAVATLMAKVKSGLWETGVADVVRGHYGAEPPGRLKRPSPVWLR
jgi:hypothetical protein